MKKIFLVSILTLLFVPAITSAQEAVPPATLSKLQQAKAKRASSEVLLNPWSGKFKAGIKATGGYTAIMVSGYGYSDTTPGYYLDGKGYGEYYTKTRLGWLFGVAAGYRQSLFSKTVEEIKTTSQIGSADADIYFGVASGNYRYDAATGNFYPKKSALVGRFGCRVRTPVSATSKTDGVEQADYLDMLNPFRVGAFVNFAYHIKGFGIGLDFEMIYSNMFDNDYLQGADISSYSASLGLLLEYTF